jgi:hypothetical protein
MARKASLLTHFPQLVSRHLDNDCHTCRAGAFDQLRPYEVEVKVDIEAVDIEWLNN